jgi:hypothetical protein
MRRVAKSKQDERIADAILQAQIDYHLLKAVPEMLVVLRDLLSCAPDTCICHCDERTVAAGRAIVATSWFRFERKQAGRVKWIDSCVMSISPDLILALWSA